MKKKKIILTGGTSLLGLKFLELYSKNYEIITFSKHDRNNPIDLLDQVKIKKLFKREIPDIIIHLAATSDRKDPNINETNYIGTQNVIKSAKAICKPVVFMSSESIYGGNKENEKEIFEDREYNPISDYAKSKVKSEELLKSSGLPYLILRGHRFIGCVKNYNKPKQFPDTIKSLLNNEYVHLESKKLFRPSFINHICEVIDYYICNNLSEKLILNCVIDKTVTYYKLIKDISDSVGLNSDLIKDDGNESGWQNKSVLSTKKLKKLGYPVYSYNKMLEQLKTDFRKIITLNDINILVVDEEGVGRNKIGQIMIKNELPKTIVIGAGVREPDSKRKDIHQEVINLLKRRCGIDVSQDKVKLLKPDMVNNKTLVLVLNDPEHLPAYVKEKAFDILLAPVEDPGNDIKIKLEIAADYIESYISLLVNILNNSFNKVGVSKDFKGNIIPRDIREV